MSATLDPKLRNGIGASQIAMLFGLSPYGGPLALYNRLVLPQADAPNAAMRRGTKAERYIAEEYAERHGLWEADALTKEDMEDSGSPYLWCPPTQRHVAHDFLIASPDRIEFRSGKPIRVVEVKTARSQRGWQDPDVAPDGAPAHYLLQVAQQMMVGLDGAPIDEGVIVASVGHLDDYREYRVRHVAAVEHAIVEKAGAFWHDHVLPRRPPEWDGSPAGNELLKALYPSGLRAEPLPAPDDVAAVMAALRHARSVTTAAEAAQARLEQQLKASIGDGPGFVGDGWKATWNQNKPSAKTDWEALARALGANDADIAKNTTTKPGARVLRPTWTDDE